MGLMIAVVLVLSYGIERPLYPRDIEPSNHTHAFDIYCRPFSAGTPPPDGYAAEIWRRIGLQALENPHELAGSAALLSLVLVGLGLKWLDKRRVIESWLNQRSAASETAPRLAWDIVVPGPVLGVAGLLVVIAASIVGCYAYYPAADESLEELRLANIEVLSAALGGNRQHALHWIPISESWLRRLQVGTYLRTGSLSDYRRMKARICRDKLELLEHMVDGGDAPEDIRKQVNATSQAFRRLNDAYRG
jgi:hypothetical protein